MTESSIVEADGEVMVRDKVRQVGEITALANRFIINPERKANLAESPKQAIIDLKSEHATNYALYLEIYNALKSAYDELWDEKAQELYGQPYTDDMPYAQRKVVRTAIPMVLSEAEPTSFGEE